MSLSNMINKQALEVLKRVVPWTSEVKVSQSKQKTNYKGCYGRIGVIGGARDYTGAPYFASMSAMRLGADLTYVICSRDASQVIKNYSSDLIVMPLLNHPDENEFDQEMDCLLTRLHALVIGPGLGRERLIQTRAKKLIERAINHSLPLILDADGLMLVNEDPASIKSYPKVLLTPNRIELQRMLEKLYTPKKFDLRNMCIDEIKELVRQCSIDLDVTILAKGLVDIVCDSSQELCTDPKMGSNRRCGGQGDITCGLAGVLVNWIEKANKNVTNEKEIIKNPMVWAGYLAVILTRIANELAYQEYGHGMLASDMLSKVHKALEWLLEDNRPESLLESDIPFKYVGCLSNDEISRYTRQMMMDEFGPSKQECLRKSSALIIGAGGLGCPAAIYLGAAGIGSLGIVDDDRVEASNLHRQILHTVEKIGMLKTESIKQAVEAINPNVQVITHSLKMDRYNAVDLIEKYDIILDCTDNLLTRYMISDACVVTKKPLVSGAALKMDGQLTVYNYNEETPCFRCLFPEPPPPNAVGSCSENGVMGVLPGIVGVQQAFEAIKLGAGMKPAYAGKMLLFDGQLGLFRHVKLKKRNENCEACGPKSKLDRSLIDYDEFCGSMVCKSETKMNDVLDSNERVTVEQYSEILKSGKPHVLVDVRPKEQSDISRFEHALQLPIMWMMQNPDETLDLVKNQLQCKDSKELYVVCRKGIASQRGTKLLQELIKKEIPDVVIKDIRGGMTTWAKCVDPKGYVCL